MELKSILPPHNGDSFFIVTEVSEEDLSKEIKIEGVTMDKKYRMQISLIPATPNGLTVPVSFVIRVVVYLNDENIPIDSVSFPEIFWNYHITDTFVSVSDIIKFCGDQITKNNFIESMFALRASFKKDGDEIVCNCGGYFSTAKIPETFLKYFVEKPPE